MILILSTGLFFSISCCSVSVGNIGLHFQTLCIQQLAHSFSGSFAGRFREASLRRCHSSSGLSRSQFDLFLHVLPDRLDDDQISVWSTGCCQAMLSQVITTVPTLFLCQ